MPAWLLPENIADVLPSEALRMEALRRQILDNFRSYGYELIVPPLLEYVESLLTGAGEDIDLRMFKLVDQLSGRALGIRADMTTQAARIDAHLLNRNSVTRLCYAGSVLHTLPSSMFDSREPLQIGAEMYGHAGLEADAEIQELAFCSLEQAGFSGIRLDLCHVGVVQALLSLDAAAKRDEAVLYRLLRTKDVPGLEEQTAHYQPVVRQALLILPSLYGDASVIQEARAVLPALPQIIQALDELEKLIFWIPRSKVMVDLSDLRGYQYESGAVFALYVPGFPDSVARGGRYDHVGEAFGRARPATGFSMDLRQLVRLLPASKPTRSIYAPWGITPQLRDRINELRQQGETVIQGLPGHENNPHEFGCTHVLMLEQGQWIFKNLA